MAADKGGSIFTPKVIFATFMMVTAGTMNTISFKFQNSYNYKHGFLQTCLMFIGEYLNLILFAVSIAGEGARNNHFREMRTEAIKSNKSLHCSKIRMGLASAFDSIGSSLQITSLLLIPASVNQMLRGGVIAFTCLLSKIFLKTQVYSHHLLGIAICILGFILVGIATIVGSDSSSTSGPSTGLVIVGILMVVASLFVQAGQFVYEEVLLTKYEVPPQRMVGIEGLFGIIFLFNWTMIFSFIKCPSNDMCDIRGYFEDPVTGLKQLFSEWGLLAWSCVTICSIMFFNNYGLMLTKYVSSVFRAFWDASRTVLVWAVSLTFGLETFVLKVFLIQVAGFICLLLGNFIYNEVIEIKFLGLNKNLRKYRASAQSKVESIQDE